MKKILILAANPTDTSQLRLGDEVRIIQNARRQARNREEIQIVSQWVRVDDLRQVLFEHKPNIVHFCGHGTGNDGLVLENEYGTKQLLSSESLAGLFKYFKNDVECVVLNACYSEVQAEAIHEHINCVIGMNQSIGDKAAIEFATGFYEALTNGVNYQDSFELGKNALDLKNIPESQTPQIKIKDNSKSLLDSNSILNNNKSIQKSDFEPIKNIPNRGTKNFVGRQDELIKIHEKLQGKNTLAISAVSGMGGVGKTELAIQYAQKHDNYYPGGICWLNARGTSLAAEILQFIQLEMGLEIPQKDFQGNLFSLTQQVSWCWQHWQPGEGLVLVVFDDVISLEGFRELLPALKRFRVLITTRLRHMEANFEEIHLDVLSDDEALDLLSKLLGKNGERKVVKELETAQEICKWLGYLPLGIELVGRYIKKKPPHFTLKKMLQQLKQQRLDSEAINNSVQETLSTAQRGVLDAFEISWVELSPQTQEVGALLSLFAADIFDWGWVESMSKSLHWDESDVETAIEELYQRHLVQCLEEDDEECGYYYQIHPLIREFLQTKLQASPLRNEIKQAFTSSFIEIAKTIPHQTTLEDINSVKNAIPHLEEVLENHLDAVSDENLCSAFIGNGRFYEGQGLYVSAEPWYQQCVSEVKSRLGENHPDTASSLKHLAILYRKMGRYDEAEPILNRALELYKQLQGVNHPDTASSLKHLAILYRKMGRFDEAEPLHKQALELYKQLQGVNHRDTASSLNNLAILYMDMGRFDEAEPIFNRALELYKQLLGVNHPRTADSLNNLAILYNDMGKYDSAEPLHKQALQLKKQLQGVNHPSTAESLNNLGLLYSNMGRYDEAEPILNRALKLRKQLLTENHPDTANSLNGLANLYKNQGNYDQAEPLFIQAVEIAERVLGESHPDTVKYRGDLEDFHRKQGEGGSSEK